MCSDKEELKKALTKIKVLEEELKATREDYMEEIIALVGKNDDLEKKIGVFMGNPVLKAKDDECTCPDNYIIFDDTDSEPSEDDFVMKLEQTSWSLQRIRISSRPPYQ